MLSAKRWRKRLRLRSSFFEYSLFFVKTLIMPFGIVRLQVVGELFCVAVAFAWLSLKSAF